MHEQANDGDGLILCYRLSSQHRIASHCRLKTSTILKLHFVFIGVVVVVIGCMLLSTIESTEQCVHRKRAHGRRTKKEIIITQRNAVLTALLKAT